jgi:hypothetical protein
MSALTPRAKEAIKTALAMTIAYGVALSMDCKCSANHPHELR